MGTRTAHGLVSIAMALGACAPADAPEPEAGSSTGEPSGSTGGTQPEASTGEAEPDPPTACAEPTDVSGRPTTIAEAIAMIDALPHPVSLDCFVEHLQRPLKLDATTSVVSLQPAVGGDSPRVFLSNAGLVMSVAVAGDPGDTLLELGEWVGPTRSIKGEVKFPVTEPLDVTAPLQRVRDGDGTKCGVCHASETAAPQYPMAYASEALRFPDDERVPLVDLREAWQACLPSRQPHRCARLDALFAWGEVQPGELPAQLKTIYDEPQ